MEFWRRTLTGRQVIKARGAFPCRRIDIAPFHDHHAAAQELAHDQAAAGPRPARIACPAG